MDEDWRNTFEILMCREICDGAGAGTCDGKPSTCSSLIYFDIMQVVLSFTEPLLYTYQRPHQLPAIFG